MTTTTAIAEDDGYALTRQVLAAQANELDARGRPAEAATLRNAMAIIIRLSTEAMEI
jgi:hypothetical protein